MANDQTLLEKAVEAIQDTAIEKLSLMLTDEDADVLAQAAADTILAALQEPSEMMIEAGKTARRPGNSVYGNSRSTWRAMLAASPLGEQSE